MILYLNSLFNQIQVLQRAVQPVSHLPIHTSTHTHTHTHYTELLFYCFHTVALCAHCGFSVLDEELQHVMGDLSLISWFEKN